MALFKEAQLKELTLQAVLDLFHGDKQLLLKDAEFGKQPPSTVIVVSIKKRALKLFTKSCLSETYFRFSFRR